MTRCVHGWRWVVVGLSVLIAAGPGVGAAGDARRGFRAADARQQLPQEDQAAILAIVADAWAAYGRGDVDGVLAAWHPESPAARTTRNMLKVMFQFRQYAFQNPRLSPIEATPEGAVGRLIVNVTIADSARKTTAEERWVRTLSLRRLGGEWRIWDDRSATEDLLAELSSLPEAEQRLARLDAERDLTAEDLQEALQREANRAFAARQNDRAIGWHQLAAQLAARHGDRGAQAENELGIAFVHQAGASHREAVAWFERALEGFEQSGSRDRQAATEMNIGAERYVLREHEAAGQHYANALRIYEELGETGWNATILHQLGNIAYLTADWDQAVEHYRRSIALQEEQAAASGSPMLAVRGIAAGYQALGVIQRELGDYPAALDALSASLARFETARDAPAGLQVREEIGYVHRLMDDHASALQWYLEAWRLAQALPDVSKDPAVDARLLAEIGDVYALEHRYATALDHFQRSLTLQEQVKSQEGIAAVLGGIGGVQFVLGRFDQALDHYERAFAIREILGDARAMARLLAQIGLVHAARGEDPAALAAYRRSLEHAEAARDREGAAIAVTLAAGALLALGEAEAGLEPAATAVSLARETSALDTLAHALVVTGELRAARGEWTLARAAIDEAVATADRIRALPGAGAPDRFFTDTTLPYLALVDLLVREGKLEEALSAAERAKQVRLQDVLDGGLAVTRGQTEAERDEERQIVKRLASLATQIRRLRAQRRPNQERAAALAGELETLKTTRQAFDRRMDEAHPALRAQRALAPLPPVRDALERVVDDRSALVEYVVTDQRVYAFVAVRSRPAPAPGAQEASEPNAVTFEVVSIDIAPLDLASQVLKFRASIAAADEEADAMGRQLYTRLLGPVDSRLAGARRLVIVPDGILWLLPFQALQPADGRYVIEDRAVACALSLSTAAGWPDLSGDRTTRSEVPTRLVALGVATTSEAASERLALLRPDLVLAPLAEAEREVRGLAGQAGPAARVLAGPDARLGRLLAEAGSADWLHLAVRGLVNDASPLHSFLALAPAPDPPGADGMVEARDILTWDLPARGVVLSRTHGDLDSVGAGAGTLAFAWSWFAAGVPAVVSSAWVVDAPSTRSMMLAFHRSLGSASPSVGPPRASEALRLAILPLLDTPRTRHPFYWAGFTVIGQ